VTLRVGVAGAGQAGERQALGFAGNPAASVVGIADLDERPASALAEQLGAAARRHWRDLFDLDLDILVVALPHNLHLEPAEEAAGRGVHLMMEKPLATSIEDGQRIVRAARSAGIRLGVSFVHRYREEVLRAKQWLELVGTPRVARESMASQRTPAHPRWITRRDVAGGGVLMYGAIHGVDRLRWFMGSEVLEVHARTHRYAADTDVEDGVAAMLVFENGAVATLTSNAPPYRAGPTPWETEVYGDTGMIRVRTREWAEFSSDQGCERYDTTSDPATRPAHYNFSRQADDFIDAVARGRPPRVTGEDGQRALEVCLAVYRSAAQGRPVRVADVRRGGST
jgi:predicted dehydrogenase